MKLLFQSLTAHAESTPEKTAVVFRQQRMTYGEWERDSNRAAHVLRANGVVAGDRVCLAIPKSPLALIWSLGILKAGAICVPLDPLSPASRIAKVLQVCTPRLVLGSGSMANVLSQLRDSDGLPPLRIGWVEAAAPSFGVSLDLTRAPAEATTRPDVRVTPEDCAYVLFTSGTTGVPKGVMMTHASIYAFNEWAVDHFRMNGTDRVSGNFALNFDPSLFDIYATLLAGATLYQVPPELHLLPVALAELIRTAELTIWWSVPAVLSYLVRFNAVRQDDFPSLTRVLWSGEACPTPVVRHLMRRLPHATFTNLYGPTETAIASTWFTVPAVPASDQEEIPIGVACPGEHVAVLDDDLAPLPVGTTGELHIAGVGLSPGYFANSSETVRAFVKRGDERWYKTGDLARVDEAGLVYFLGRKDSQIKVRGYRIELGEVESALHAVAGLSEVCVVAIAGAGGPFICCAYASRTGEPIGIDVARGELAQLIPAYMLPVRWQHYDHIPRNANGKLDRPQVAHDFQERETALAAQL
jgi:amino acid adenylation domain-containing protein